MARHAMMEMSSTGTGAAVFAKWKTDGSARPIRQRIRVIVRGNFPIVATESSTGGKPATTDSHSETGTAAT